MESPIEIINNVCIEVNRIRKKNGEYYFAKRYMFIADIVSIEGDVYGEGMTKCTRLDLRDDTFIKVKEPYKKLKETHEIWWKHVQDSEKEPGE